MTGVARVGPASPRRRLAGHPSPRRDRGPTCAGPGPGGPGFADRVLEAARLTGQPVGIALRSADDRGTTFVQSLERGLAVIRTFDRQAPASTPSEVAAATGLTRAAARRFLLTLADLGYVRAEGRAFRLSPRVLELGRAYLSGLTLPDAALPHLRELVGERARVVVRGGARRRADRLRRARLRQARALGVGDGRIRRPGVRDLARPRPARCAERRVARPVPGDGRSSRR